MKCIMSFLIVVKYYNNQNKVNKFSIYCKILSSTYLYTYIIVAAQTVSTTRVTTKRTTRADPARDVTMTTGPQIPVEGEDFIVRCQRSSQQAASFTYCKLHII